MNLFIKSLNAVSMIAF